MTDQQLMQKYYDIITADYRSCYTGLDMMKKGFEKGTLEDMVDVLKEFFVGVGSQKLIDFKEVTRERPELLPLKNVFHNFSGTKQIFPNNTQQKFYFIQDDELNGNVITLKIFAGAQCRIESVNCKMNIEVSGNSRLECHANDSDIKITLTDYASALMVNVDNHNPVTVINKGVGSYHYKEISFSR